MRAGDRLDFEKSSGQGSLRVVVLARPLGAHFTAALTHGCLFVA